VRGLCSGCIQYTPNKTVGREEFKEMDEFNIIADAKEYAVIEPSVKKAKIIADAVCFVRDMISARPPTK
jgi:hypothetical protein